MGFRVWGLTRTLRLAGHPVCRYAHPKTAQILLTARKDSNEASQPNHNHSTKAQHCRDCKTNVGRLPIMIEADSRPIHYRASLGSIGSRDGLWFGVLGLVPMALAISFLNFTSDLDSNVWDSGLPFTSSAPLCLEPRLLQRPAPEFIP